MNIDTYVKLALSTLAGIAAYIWGPWDALLAALVIMVAIDYVTGVIKAAVKRTLSSEIGWKGLLKKLMIFMLVGLGCVVDRFAGSNGAVRTAICTFYIANEALSVLENAGEMGLPLPKFLKTTLLKLGGDEPGYTDESNDKGA
ncbi:MAG TPA: phage holin family protein [Eubacteriales bacterium]|nr:phage holin family protein [Clostridia bacterium]HRV72785.1 phage holin family protein [Eubacteriales bacterium]